MQIQDIPFVRLTGLQINPEGRLVQPFSDAVVNHLGTMHAGVQFALAETASGHFLQQRFATLADDVIPVLRRTEMKYRRPVTAPIEAYAWADPAQLATFVEKLGKSGRATVEIRVELRLTDGTVVADGIFGWFVTYADGKRP